ARWNIGGPAVAAAALLAVDGHRFWYEPRGGFTRREPSDRPNLVLPEVWVDRVSSVEEPDEIVRPLLAPRRNTNHGFGRSPTACGYRQPSAFPRAPRRHRTECGVPTRHDRGRRLASATLAEAPRLSTVRSYGWLSQTSGRAGTRERPQFLSAAEPYPDGVGRGSRKALRWTMARGQCPLYSRDRPDTRRH